MKPTTNNTGIACKRRETMNANMVSPYASLVRLQSTYVTT